MTVLNANRIAMLISSLLAVTSLVVLFDRSGLIAGLALLMGLALLIKIWRKPSAADLTMSLCAAAFGLLAWAGTLYYVISTYESGEVVELIVNTDAGEHTARLWVMDVDGDEVVYYDAEPEVAASLLASNTVRFSRGGEVSTRVPNAAVVDALPEEMAEQILANMAAKYGDRMKAVDVYYLLLGRPYDRIGLVAWLLEPGKGQVADEADSFTPR